MRAAKEITLIGIYTALLIGGQFVLYALSGVEIVTVLMMSFAYVFGIRRGIMVATCFSLVRCFVFGFFPTVVILYLVYYNIFAAVFGALGRRYKARLDLKIHAVLVVTAVLLTACFTGLDDIITPLFYGYTIGAAKAYAVASLTALVPQTLCAAVTGALVFPVLYRVLVGTDYIVKK